MLETALIVFIVFAALVCLFAIVLIVKDIIDERRAKRDGTYIPYYGYYVPMQPVMQPAQPAPQQEAPAQQEPAPAAEEEPAPAETEEEVAEDEAAATSANAVTFEHAQNQTLEEKYMELSATQKGYYDEIVKYAAAVEGSKRLKNLRYEEYKIGTSRVVRLLIKRGVVVCEFILPNSDFKNYVNENKVSVRLNATVMKVTDDNVVQAAKDSIDIVVKSIAEEKEYKKQLAKERRKAKRDSAK